MKKLLGIVGLSLLLTGNAFAKIDNSYKKQIYEGCINDAKRNNDFNSASKKFCKCYANQFDKRFNNEQLINFLSKSDQVKAQIVQNEIAPPCYPKASNVSNSNKKIIKLKDCNWDSRASELKDLYYEIDLNKNSVTSVMTWNEAGVKELDLDGPTQIETLPIKHVTSNIIETHKINVGPFDRRILIHLDDKIVEVTLIAVNSGYKINHTEKCN